MAATDARSSTFRHLSSTTTDTRARVDCGSGAANVREMLKALARRQENKNHQRQSEDLLPLPSGQSQGGRQLLGLRERRHRSSQRGPPQAGSGAHHGALGGSTPHPEGPSLHGPLQRPKSAPKPHIGPTDMKPPTTGRSAFGTTSEICSCTPPGPPPWASRPPSRSCASLPANQPPCGAWRGHGTYLVGVGVPTVVRRWYESPWPTEGQAEDSFSPLTRFSRCGKNITATTMPQAPIGRLRGNRQRPSWEAALKVFPPGNVSVAKRQVWGANHLPSQGQRVQRPLQGHALSNRSPVPTYRPRCLGEQKNL